MPHLLNLEHVALLVVNLDAGTPPEEPAFQARAAGIWSRHSAPVNGVSAHDAGADIRGSSSGEETLRFGTARHPDDNLLPPIPTGKGQCYHIHTVY